MPVMDEGRKRVLAIVAGILVARPAALRHSNTELTNPAPPEKFVKDSLEKPSTRHGRLEVLFCLIIGREILQSD
jgi:hypothetical protein